MALLAGGPIRVFDTCVVRLIDAGAISYNGRDKFDVAGPLPSGADPIERQLYEAVSKGGNSGRAINEVRKEAAFDLDARRAKLREAGLLLGDGAARMASFLPALLTLATIFGLGAPRAVAGVANDKPSGFIILLMVVGFIVTFVRFGKVRRRTLRGDDVIRQEIARTRSAKPHVVMGTAVLGTAALAATELALLGTALHPRVDPTSSGSGCGSSCSSGGGGGGDGGGGGCGGGCGGGGD